MKQPTPSSAIAELGKIQCNVVGTPDYVKVACILILVKGHTLSVVSDFLEIELSTVYVAVYQSKGIDGLFESCHKGYWGLLDSRQLSVLRKELLEHIYTDTKSVAAWIKVTFGIEYTPQGVVDLLNRIGFTYNYKKISEVPCEADSSKQEAFARELTDLLPKMAMPDDAVVYYAGGIHPTHNSRSTYAWIDKGKRLEQPTVCGLDRVNINELLNVHDVTDVIVHDCESVNAEFTKSLYQEALERHPEASVIYIVAGNARYYHNKKLKEWVDRTKIKQIFLPPYSPNLNLIERLWKFLRKKIINTGFYRIKEKFKQAIRDFFVNIRAYKEKLESLLTLKFSLCNSQDISFYYNPKK